MVVLGRTLFVVHLVFLLLAGILFGASFGGFLGGGYMITSALLVIVSWGVFAGLMVNAVRLAIHVANDTGSSPQALMWSKALFPTLTILTFVTRLGLVFLSVVGCGVLLIARLY